MKKCFAYFKERYGVSLIETDTYKIRNNHASVYAAKDVLGNSIITSADLYFRENIFQKYAYDAFYCTVYVEGVTEERGVETDCYDRIIKTAYGLSDTWVTLGYAVFNHRFSENYIAILEKEYDLPQTLPKFWADIQDEHIDKLYMYVKRIREHIIYEFDNLEELRSFDDHYRHSSGSKLMADIAGWLRVSEKDLTGFKPVVRENLTRGFTFFCNKGKYICRVDQTGNVQGLHRYDQTIQELVNLTESFESYYEKTIPLCAAENVISEFVKMPLSMGFQERYIIGNTYSYREQDNFVGSNYLLPFYEMISEKCYELFGAKYTDARTLTGMNCLMVVLMALSTHGDKILVLDPEAGGHASVKPIAQRLGLIVDSLPFDYKTQDIAYDELNHRLATDKIDFILLVPSDLIHLFDITSIRAENTILLYDASQILGLLAAGLAENPLCYMENLVLFGGTHKTLPGPASGLIMTNNEGLHRQLEQTINPIYIRHTQMHQKVSLLFALVEFGIYGKAYEEHIVELSNILGEELNRTGFRVGRTGEQYSQTHELFLYTTAEEMERIYENSVRFGITLNKKKKKLFLGQGIRLGTQEIARYGWPAEAMEGVAQIIAETVKTDPDDKKIRKLLGGLPEKNIQFTFDKNVLSRFMRFM